jgi:hypothetical protein
MATKTTTPPVSATTTVTDKNAGLIKWLKANDGIDVHRFDDPALNLEGQIDEARKFAEKMRSTIGQDHRILIDQVYNKVTISLT